MVRFFKLNAHDRHYGTLVEREFSYQKSNCKIFKFRKFNLLISDCKN